MRELFIEKRANKPITTLEKDKWELYNTKDDFSLTFDLADQQPKKLAELKELFRKEAIKNHVYPLDDRSYERFNAEIAGRPSPMGKRTSMVLSQGMGGMTEGTFLNTKNKSVYINADLELKGDDRGVIIAQGGRFGGWSLYMVDGKPMYTYNWFGVEQFTVKSRAKIRKKNARVSLKFIYEGKKGEFGKGGTAELYVDGKMVGSSYIGKTIPFAISADDPAGVGFDELSQVAFNEFEDYFDSKFTGKIPRVEISTQPIDVKSAH